MFVHSVTAANCSIVPGRRLPLLLQLAQTGRPGLFLTKSPKLKKQLKVAAPLPSPEEQFVETAGVFRRHTIESRNPGPGSPAADLFQVGCGAMIARV
jgi:hypothetical protein